uniref:HORMA domain containing 1 n=1 Tax=Xiphophorus maculatus TaxID=8083 RepID=M4A3H1_XIPMA
TQCKQQSCLCRLIHAAQVLPDEVASEQQSLIVVKKLLAIAVSGITYLRGIFPGRAYGSKYIYTDPSNPQKVTEYYHFKIQYTTEGTQVDFESINNQKLSAMSLGNTRKAGILLVRKLYTLMQSLGPLPENVCLNMKLGYYDEVTPQDYQPPGFSEAVGNTIEFVQEPVKLTMGKVATPYHCVTFDMATERRRLEQIMIMEASDMELGVKRTRSGRIIKSFTVGHPVKTNQPTSFILLSTSL